MKMNKIIENDTILYLNQDDFEVVLDINRNCKVDVYHFVINHSSSIMINLNSEGATVNYHYSTINYDDHEVKIEVNHKEKNTTSNLYNHGVNVKTGRLNFLVNGIVPKDMVQCICNQENQIINISDGKSTICPNLLIDCYDVVSSHSAYIGKFSLEKVFYLESRGFSKETAYQLLLKGFLIFEGVNSDILGDYLLEIENI